MTMRTVFLRLWLVLLAFTASTLPAADDVVRYEASHDAMGTVFTVVAYGKDRDYLGEVLSEVFEEIDRLDQQMSNYQPESELSAINRYAAERAVTVEPRLFQLLHEALDYSAETEGAFDITVGPLMKAWGFFRGPGRVPSTAELEAVRKHVGFRHVRLDEERRTVRFAVEGMELDLGGIGKGYAVDQAVEILKSYGIESALVSNGRSSLYALGAPPGEQAWRVKVRDPFDAEKTADVIRLKNFSLSTSGDYEKFFTLGGRTYAHILDPSSGHPVEGMLATAVLAPRATQTDALSTALYVLGAQRSRRYVAAHPNLTAIFYLPKGATRSFRRVTERSATLDLGRDVVAEIEALGGAAPSRPSSEVSADALHAGARSLRNYFSIRAVKAIPWSGVLIHTTLFTSS